MRSAPRVLLYQVGEAPDPILAAHGGYASWYERAWGAPLEVLDGRAASRVPDARDYDAVIVTGSPASLVEGERPRWADEAALLVRGAHEKGVPLLGVCFGHQLIAWALGGRVIKNPRGWEVGRCEVELLEREDPLFAGLGARAWVNQTHRDVVDAGSLPSGVRVLARNARVDVQALAAGDHVRGVQFHPEIDGAVSKAYVRVRYDALRGEGLDPDALLDGAGDAPDAVAMLQNFRTRFVRA